MPGGLGLAAYLACVLVWSVLVTIWCIGGGRRIAAVLDLVVIDRRVSGVRTGGVQWRWDC